MRNEFAYFVLCVLLFAFCASAEAQQPVKVPRIGYLSGSSPSGSARGVEAFRRGLRDLGYIEGKSILVEYRYAGGEADRIPSLVGELVHQNVDVLVSSNFSAIRTAKQATNTIPIVMLTTQDPVATGLINSLARPGGNITGISRLTTELGAKRLELLKEIVPTLSRVGVLISDTRALGTDLRELETTARALKIELQSLVVRGPKPDLKGAFHTAAKGYGNALMTGRGPVLNNYRKLIADLAIQNQLPLMSEGNDYVEAGALASYSADEAESFRRGAIYVDKILKGSKPSDLPVEQPTKFEFIINLKTANQIRLMIPPNVLARADKVIKR